MPHISASAFVENHFTTLQPGDTAFQGMLFPGVYPNPEDRRIDELAKEGYSITYPHPFHNQTRRLVARGVTVQWLRVIPEVGIFGFTRDDVDALEEHTAIIARASNADVRITGYEEHARTLYRQGANNSWIINSYLRGAEQREPHASFWRIDRSQRHSPDYVGVMDYHGDAFLGHRLYGQGVEQEVHVFTRYWMKVYHTQAQAI